MYIVKDNQGTKRTCWTFTQAMEWLPFFPGSRVEIVARFTGRVLAARHQEI